MKNGKTRPLLLLGAACLAAGVLAWQATLAVQGGTVFSRLPLLVSLVVLAIGLAIAGMATFYPPEANGVSEPADFRHVFPLIGTVGAILLVALVAREFLVPPTFGEYGRYRGDAVQDARARTPHHQGKATCVGCHDELGKTIDANAHKRISCEVCHGPGWKHVEAGGDVQAISKPLGDKALCLTCHRKLAARPADFPQIKWEEHFEVVGADKDAACISCHQPHEPAPWLSTPRTREGGASAPKS